MRALIFKYVFVTLMPVLILTLIVVSIIAQHSINNSKLNSSTITTAQEQSYSFQKPIEEN